MFGRYFNVGFFANFLNQVVTVAFRQKFVCIISGETIDKNIIIEKVL